jgi:maltose alpha-D-glucosyltransferase/alpha-amylase
LGFTLAKLRSGARMGALIDATQDEDFIRDLATAIDEGRRIETAHGRVEFYPGPKGTAVSQEPMVRPLGVEQSNMSVIVDDRIMIKIYRRVRTGVQPEIEVSRFLTEIARFPSSPDFLGAVEHVNETGERTALAIAFAFIPNQGDAWNAVVEALDRALEDLEVISTDEESPETLLDKLYVFPLNLGKRLGERTGELHRAFATPTQDPAFAPENLTAEDMVRWARTVREDAERVLSELVLVRGTLSEAAEQHVAELLLKRAALLKRIDAIGKCPAMGVQTRIHGDYRLGQVLISKDELVIFNFEGSPAQPFDERRQKSSPLRDVAGMLRSIDYAASAAVERFAARSAEVSDVALAVATAWRNRASREFLRAYIKTVKGMPSYPADARVAADLLDLFLLQKALHEIADEVANRPAWLSIPVRGVLDLLAGRPHR